MKILRRLNLTVKMTIGMKQRISDDSVHSENGIWLASAKIVPHDEGDSSKVG